MKSFKKSTALSCLMICAFFAACGLKKESSGTQEASASSQVTRDVQTRAFPDSIPSPFQVLKLSEGFAVIDPAGDVLLTDLLFAEKLNSALQVLSKEGEMMYYDFEGNRLQEHRDFFGVCGTVPHYTLSILENDAAYVVQEIETFYTPIEEQKNEPINTIWKASADSICFLNKRKEFQFTSNFGIFSDLSPNPRTVVYYKDGKLKFSESAQRYDDFWLDAEVLYVRNGEAVGIHPILEPQFSRIERFEGALAKVVFLNGKEGYIDTKGNIYSL
jgi:hypothetical protein